MFYRCYKKLNTKSRRIVSHKEVNPKRIIRMILISNFNRRSKNIQLNKSKKLDSFRLLLHGFRKKKKEIGKNLFKRESNLILQLKFKEK